MDSKFFAVVVVGLLILSVGVSGCTGSNGGEDNEKIKNLTNQVSNLESEVSNLKDTISELEDKNQELINEKKNLEDKISSLKDEKSELGTQVDNLKEKLNNSETDQDDQTPVTDKSTVVNDVKIGVSNVEIKSKVTSDYLSKEANGKFIKINLQIINQRSEPVDINTRNLRLKDNEERTFKYDSDATMVFDNGLIVWEGFNPGIEYDRVMVFDVPKDSKDLKLQVSGEFGVTNFVSSGMKDIQITN